MSVCFNNQRPGSRDSSADEEQDEEEEAEGEIEECEEALERYELDHEEALEQTLKMCDLTDLKMLTWSAGG